MLTDSETELTTAVTDALLGVVCLLSAVWIWSVPTAAVLRRGLWVSGFALMSCAAWLGAVVHGWRLSGATGVVLWRPLYLSLGLAVALTSVAAVLDLRGEAVARSVLPWAIVVGVLFFVVTDRAGGSFFWFVVYEGVAMLLSLGIYVKLALGHDLDGAAWIALGIAISIGASAVQASRLSLRLLVRFDHNGLFHLVQLVGACAMAAGVHAGFTRW